MSPEANQAEPNPAPTAAQIAAAHAEVDKGIADQAEKANAETAAKRESAASDKAEDAEASAAVPVEAPDEAEPPHPAIAQLEGPASDLGHVVDISGADYDELPVGPVVVDDHGRLWRVRQRKVDVIEEREGDEEPVTHTERREELVLVGRVQR